MQIATLTPMTEDERNFEPAHITRVLEALGETDSAVAAYEEAVRPIHRTNLSFVALGPLCLYHLARAEESTGRTESARAHYEEFVRLWDGADAELTHVEDARERLAGLAE